MKKTTLLTLSLLLAIASVWARPALKLPVPYLQPDGTTVTIRLQGDEYHHYITTTDGYTLVRTPQGCYVYARLDAAGRLAPTSLVAHDEEARTEAERTYLHQTGHITPRPDHEATQAAARDAQSRRQALTARREKRYDYDSFRGLVILVEYNDCSFTYDDYKDIMDEMINQENYTGNEKTNFHDPFSQRDIVCTGSMYDYFQRQF